MRELALSNKGMTPEAVAAMHEKAQETAKSRLGQAACGACPLARICSIKSPGDCDPNAVAQQGGGEFVSSGDCDISYKKQLQDDRINVVIARRKKKIQTPQKQAQKNLYCRPNHITHAQSKRSSNHNKNTKPDLSPTILQQLVNAVGKILEVDTKARASK